MQQPAEQLPQAWRRLQREVGSGCHHRLTVALSVDDTLGQLLAKHEFHKGETHIKVSAFILAKAKMKLYTPSSWRIQKFRESVCCCYTFSWCAMKCVHPPAEPSHLWTALDTWLTCSRTSFPLISDLVPKDCF